MKRTTLALLISGILSSGCVIKPPQYNLLKKSHFSFSKMYQMCHDNKFDIDTRCINSQKTLDSIVNSSYAIINRAKYILPKYAPKAAKAYFNKMHTVLGKDGLLPVNSGTAVMLPKGYMVSCKHVFKEKLKPLIFNYGPAKGSL